MSKKSETTVEKARPAIEATIDMANPMNPALTLTFGDEEELVFTPSMTTPAIATMAMMHGFKQKLVDAAAIARNTETGRSATLDDKKAAVGEVYARLLNGEWNKAREGATPQGGLLLRALAELYPNKTHEQLKAWVEGLTDEQAKSLRGNAKVAPVIARLRAGSVKAEAAKEADELLAGLGEPTNE